MTDLNIDNLSYFIIDGKSSAKNILIGKGYTLYKLLECNNFNYSESFIAISNINDDILESDYINLLKSGVDNFIIKYNRKDKIYKCYNESKKLQSIEYFPESNHNSFCLMNTIFKFNDKKEYIHIKDRSEIQNGMIIEFCNNNKWTKKEVIDIDSEYDKIYKLMIKHNKLRKEKGN